MDEATLANKAKTEFLSRMSHDIRTPINGVMGMLEIIKKNREDHERVDDCLERSMFPPSICCRSSTMFWI